MKLYRHAGNIKSALFMMGIALVIGLLAYTQILVNQLRKDNRSIVRLYAGMIANIVQDEYENIHGTFTTEEALKYWSQGKRIDVNQYYGFKNQSVHQLIKLYIK